MKSPLLYILEVLFCSGLLLAFYRLLLAVSYTHLTLPTNSLV